MSVFDVIFGLVLFVSVAIGYARGGVREAFTLFAFALAALAAVTILPLGVWLFGHLIHPRWLAVVVAIVVVFVLAYLAVRMLGASATARLRGSSLGGVDRIAGAGVGMVRALVLLGLVSLLLESAPWPQQRPGWMRHSLSYPLARSAGRLVARAAPVGGRATAGLLRFVSARVISGVQDPEAPSVRADDKGAADAESETSRSDATERRRHDLVWAGGSR